MTRISKALILAFAAVLLLGGCGASKDHQIQVERWAPTIDEWAKATHDDLVQIMEFWRATNNRFTAMINAGCELEKKVGVPNAEQLFCPMGPGGDPPAVDPPKCDFGQCPPN